MTCCFLLLLGLAAEPAVLLKDGDLARLKAVAGNSAEVRRVADRALGQGPWSVTAHRPPNLPGLDRHEYFSEGPYWWPDPKNPGSPYIRRDGERNPDRFDDNHRDLSAMSDAVLALGMGAALLDDARYADHAAVILRAWFADPKTRMNPDLEHGQAIRGHNDGRGTGIIDTVALIHAVQGIALLEKTGRLDAGLVTALHSWFADYTGWLTTSAKGRDEEKAANNHGTWWTAQVAAFASYLGDEALMRRMWQRYRNTLTAQIKPDGSLPLEEARTRSLSYAAYDLDAFAVLCRVAEARGENLWPPLAKPVARYAPFVADPGTWKKQQIAEFDAASNVFPALAGLGLRDSKLLDLWRGMRHGSSPWVLLADLLVKAR